MQQESSSLPPVRVAIIRGNIVTLKAIVYGGYVEVADDTIMAIEPAGTPIPTAEEIQRRYCHLPYHSGTRGRTKRNKTLIESNDESGGGGDSSATEDAQSISNAGKGGEETTPKQQRMVLLTVSQPHGFILPGFVDIHNHGVGGATEVLDHWMKPEVSQKYLARCGTLSTLASVIFSTTRSKAIDQVISTIEDVVGKVEPGMAVIEGIHAEGPVIADPGGLPPSQSEISEQQFLTLCDKMPSCKIMTIAPSKEVECDYARIKVLLERGVRPSLGHDRHCSEKAVLGAMRVASAFKEGGGGKLTAGGGKIKTNNKGALTTPMTSSTFLDCDVLHSTHFCNVMGFHHRNPSLVNFALCSSFPRANKYQGIKPLTTEVIADLIHVHPLTIQGLLSARGPEHVAVITDCISTYEPGRRLTYTNREIVVRAEGGCYLCDAKGKPTQTLAGSTVTLADEFYTLVSHFGLDLVTTCRLLATTPAAIANINHVGAIEVGRKANLLVLDSELKTITGRMIYGHWAEGVDPYRMLKPSISHL